MNARIAPPVAIAMDPDLIVRSARSVIGLEASAIQALEPRIGP